MKYQVQDPNGTTLLLEGGDSPPTEDDLKQAFGQHYANAAGSAVDQTLNVTKGVTDVLTNPAAGEAAKEGRRQDLAEQTGFARAEAKNNAVMNALVGGAEKATDFVSQMEPFNLARRTIELPQQLTGGVKYKVAPAVSPELARKVVDFLDPSGSIDKAGTSKEGLKQFAAETLSTVTSPDQAAALLTGKVKPELAARLFQTQMASQIPGAAYNLKQAIDSGDKSEVAKATAGLALSIGGPALIEKGIRSEEPKGIPNAETIRKDSGQPIETGQVGERGQTDSGGDVQQAPSGAPNATSPQGQAPGEVLLKQAAPSGESGVPKPSEAPVSAAVEPSVSAEGTPQASTDVNVTPDVTQQGVNAPLVGMGGAALGEIPETGSGSDIYGIAQRIREERAKAGQTAITQPGEGMSAVEAVIHGQELLEKDPDAAQKAVDQFRQNKAISTSGISAVRAMGEKAFSQARKIEEKFGTDSPEYKAAKAEEEKWNKVSKEMQTEWSDQGKAQQGQTDIDTGSFTGLQRARRESSGKDFTPEQAKAAKEVAARSKAASKEAQAAKERLFDAISTPEQIDARVKSIAERIVAAMDRAGQDALARIKARRAEGRLTTGLDPVDLADHAIYGASVIAKGALDFAKWSEEMLKTFGDYVKPELDKIWKRSNEIADESVTKGSPGPLLEKVKKTVRSRNAEKAALDAANKTVRDANVALAKAETKARVAKTVSEKQKADIQAQAARKALESAETVRKRAAEQAAKAERTPSAEPNLDEQSKAAQKALEAAQQVTARAAADLAKAENAKNAAKTSKAKSIAEVQEKAAKKALDAAQKVARDAAAKAAETERKLQSDPTARVWKQARVYLDKGLDSFDDIRHKVATDLGMKVDQVTRLMAQDKRVKYLADDLWRKQQAERRIKASAKRWVENLDVPGYRKAINAIPRILFSLKVGFHGTVALGTHAPVVAFQPRFWKNYVTDFGKMYRMVGSPAYFERQMQDLVRRDNYTVANRAGLVNDPFTAEDYTTPEFAQRFSKLVPESIRKFADAASKTGNRGYSVLKILRQDMFDQMWSNLPKSSQIPEVASAIADSVNHATGVVKGMAPKGSNLAFFAPRLEASRVMWLAGDPIRAADIVARWKNASLGEKEFVRNQIKEKLWVFGTFASILALNQGILSATDSKQKINGIPKSLGGSGFNPLESDFLKLKIAGMDAAYGSAMVNMAKLPVRVATALMFEGKTSKLVLEDERIYKIALDYVRSQLSPFAGTTADLLFGRDFQERPLPRKAFGFLPGDKDIPKRLRMHGITKPYSWPEYSSEQFTPIPISEGVREVWGQGMGMSDKQIGHYLKAMAIIGVMAGTGARVNEDKNVKR